MPTANNPINPEQDIWWYAAWERGELSYGDYSRIIREAGEGVAYGVWDSTYGQLQLLNPMTWWNIGKLIVTSPFLAWMIYRLSPEQRAVFFAEISGPLREKPVKQAVRFAVSLMLSPIVLKKALGTANTAAQGLASMFADKADDLARAATANEEAIKAFMDVASKLNESKYAQQLAAHTGKLEVAQAQQAKMARFKKLVDQLQSLHRDTFNAGQSESMLRELTTLSQELSINVQSSIDGMWHWLGRVKDITWHNTKKGGKYGGRLSELSKRAAEAAKVGGEKAANLAAQASDITSKAPVLTKVTVPTTIKEVAQETRKAAEAASRAAKMVAEYVGKVPAEVTDSTQTMTIALSAAHKASQIAPRRMPEAQPQEDEGFGFEAAHDLDAASATRETQTELSPRAEAGIQTEPNQELCELRATIESLHAALIQKDEEAEVERAHYETRYEYVHEKYQQLNARAEAADTLVLSLETELQLTEQSLEVSVKNERQLFQAYTAQAEEVKSLKAENATLRERDLMAAPAATPVHIALLQQQLLTLRSELVRCQRENTALHEALKLASDQHKEAIDLRREISTRARALEAENADLFQELEDVAKEITVHTPRHVAAARRQGFFEGRVSAGNGVSDPQNHSPYFQGKRGKN